MDIINLANRYIDSDYLIESIHDKYLFKSVFMAGGPGSGKSFISNEMFSGLEVMVVDSDRTFTHLLNKFSLPLVIDPSKEDIHSKQMDIRGQAKGLTSERAYHWLNGMLPLVIDGTGKDYDKISNQVTNIRKIGYDAHMVFVNTSLDIALERNSQRERKLDEEMVKKYWRSVQENIGKFQNLFGGDNFLIVDNNEVLPEHSEFLLKLRRNAINFLRSPLKNKIGRNILSEMEKKGKSYLSDLYPDIKLKL